MSSILSERKEFASFSHSSFYQGRIVDEMHEVFRSGNLKVAFSPSGLPPLGSTFGRNAVRGGS